MSWMRLIGNVVVSVLVVFAFGVLAPPSHAQHEGHNMPAPAKPPRKPVRRTAPKKKTVAVQRRDQNVNEPGPVTAPETSSLPANVDTTTPESPLPTVPNNTPQVTDTLPKPAPAAEPTKPKPAPPMDHSQMGNMDGNGSAGKSTSTGAGDSDSGMTVMEHDSGTASENSLMVMSGEEMDIRVGASKRNSIAMGQMGSGTSWQPATTPMFMWYKSVGEWLVFLHGDMKLGVNHQGGPRGITKFESQNWIMPMAFRRLGRGTLQLRGMFSLEPFSFPRGGSPLLFQTGETYQNRPLVDAQHPHDLFMELSASYTLPLGERSTWFTYVGFPGEPALGPTAFMHRMSASENPSAPLSHHLQDSTHISFGVLTSGFTYRWIKVEGSLFNGREPDENRYDFEFNPWNSRSVRISVAPNENWSAQWSYGLLKTPEALEPGDVRRMTASVGYNRRFKRGNWATSLIWGRNVESHDERTTLNGYTAESTLNFFDKNYVYTRLELVDKNNLLSNDEAQSLGFATEHPSFRIGAYTFGYVRDVWNTSRFSIGLGSDFTVYSKPALLDSLYGDNPTSNRFFVRVRPSRMSRSSGHGH